MSNYKKSGFSLIELMVVIAIVALLAAVAVPSYKNYKTRAEISKVLNVIPFYKQKITEHYNKTGTMPSAVDLAIDTGGTTTVNSTYYASAGSYVSYIELSRRSSGASLCPTSPSTTTCSDLIFGWSSGLGIGTANLMWVRFVEQNGVISVQCGLHENVPGIYRGLYPPSCQGISPGYTTFNVS